MPVDFLTDEQAAADAGFVGAPSQTELERFFPLDDADRSVVEKRRGDANRLGFGVQLGTVRQPERGLATRGCRPPIPE